MGKGIIKSGGTDGLYGVELTLHRDRLDAITEIIDSQIAALTTEIDGMEEGDAKELKKLNRASYEKRKEYILNNMPPEDPTVSAWCGDLTEDLSGNVGTIEIPGERGIVQIQPGYDDNAAYNTERDGQLQPAIANTPEGTFYNLAMLPGWQKWMPTYRHGIISNIDTDNDTCDVALDVVESSQQGLAVNQESNLSGIPIEYMSCNSIVFEDGDSVLVKFEGQEWGGAKVVGFRDNPKVCCVFKEQWGTTLCENNDGWYFSDQPLCTLSPFASLADGILSASVSNNTVHLSKSHDFVLSPTTFVPKEIKIKITASASTSEIHSVWVGLGLKTDLTGWHFFVFAQDNLAPDPDMYYIGDGELVIDISDYYEIPDNDNLQRLDVRCYGLGGGASYDLDYIEIIGNCVPY